MARKNAIPAGFAISFASAAPVGTIPAAPEYAPHFRVRRAVADKTSAPVVVSAIHFDEKIRQIQVFCSDGNVRKCNVDRLPTIETGRMLWKLLQTVGKKQTTVVFKAAGGFSPDTWFYTIEQQ